MNSGLELGTAGGTGGCGELTRRARKPVGDGHVCSRRWRCDGTRDAPRQSRMLCGGLDAGTTVGPSRQRALPGLRAQDPGEGGAGSRPLWKREAC